MRFSLVVTKDQRRLDHIAFEGGLDSVVVGRSEECDVRLDSLNVSRRHCELLALPGAHLVRDLGSHNGTFVNGRRVTERALNPGDVISVGEFALRFDAVVEAAPAAPRAATYDAAERTMKVAPAAPATGAYVLPRAARPLAHVLVPAQQRAVLMRQATLLIGAAPTAELHLAGAPRAAAAIVRDGDGFLLVDLSPRRDAVRVGGAPVTQVPLAVAEVRLEVAGEALIFRRGPPRVDDETAARPTGRLPKLGP